MLKFFAFPRWLIWHPPLWFLFWASVAPLIFFTDRYLTVTLQTVPALLICWLLIGALTTRPRYEQLLLCVLVVVVTICEIVASLVLHWYTYRLHNVPLWIPPGHAVVFLTARVSGEQLRAKSRPNLLRFFGHRRCLGVWVTGVVGVTS